MISKKKGQIGGLQGIILTLVVVGILLGVGYLILNEFKGAVPLTTETIVNESVTPTTTGVYLKYNSTTAGVYCYENVVIQDVVNKSGSLVIVPANYSVNSATGLFQNITGCGTICSGGWNVTYTYEADRTGSCAGLEAVEDATDNIPDFLPIIVIVGVIGILLAIVFGLPKLIRDKSETAYV